ncbi:3-hydroxyacyl-CoA dehydrogenase NAD-binding domain-containing protein [uncultured Methylibium sp.]|uniref:3-hydroxyacyl-CoA dehydrogenase NAD-binding domain-containing protein n=1 Tax=uncultured Methylibium sp. TaxID=381093 RepID=UPI0025F4F3DD|nr:3-hydroxyacyl-CoA dehydrogenase NAD-binding domain-containing protein [uncultured Methylibium sp.]
MNPPGQAQRDAVFVIGAGIMGAGIAQVAAQAGHAVLLHDSREGAAAEARRKLGETLAGLVRKGRLADEEAAAVLERIRPATSLADAAGTRLVVEAIVENLDIKRALFRELEAIVGDDCVLASNTSSISITALANGLKRPGRFVGMHFFNPVPLMKLVEVVSGLQTDATVAEAIFDLSKAWGKVPVHARSTPGFIVNRIARPYYAETLALLHERAAEPAVLDACLRGAGFRMGPCELMDLIGHDTNFAVTESVFQANFGDKRYQPSLVQREMVDGGLLGRKTGRGFYDYATPRPAPAESAPRSAGPIAETAAFGRTDGRTATQRAADAGQRDGAVFDWTTGPNAAALAYAVSATASENYAAQVAQAIAAAGHEPQRIADTPGLVVARTLAMLVNEAADAVQQGVCNESGADLAMKLGVSYPAGPFEWFARFGVRDIVQLLDRLDEHYRGERYRTSPWLRQRAWAAAR